MRLLGIAALLSTLLLGPPALAGSGIEDYASYESSSKCHPKARPGTEYLAHWMVRKYGGGFGGTSRPCDRKATSEHQNGRAFDWSLDATRRADRQRAREFMRRIFQTDARGNTDAWARRMGVMYVIWNDTMYPAWHQLEPEPYLSSGCHKRNRCSKTLRHRDHLHISLSGPGARGVTSWYDGRIQRRPPRSAAHLLHSSCQPATSSAGRAGGPV